MEPENSPLELSSEARQTLVLARQLEGLVMNPAWLALFAALGQFRDEALVAIKECRSSNAQLRSNLLTKWEERSRTVEFLTNYIASIKDNRRRILRELAELNGHYGDAAENFLDSLQGTGD